LSGVNTLTPQLLTAKNFSRTSYGILILKITLPDYVKHIEGLVAHFLVSPEDKFHETAVNTSVTVYKPQIDITSA
jgi:hypothetical protein